jgi:DNA-binding PadR family transcriptional regulator
MSLTHALLGVLESRPMNGYELTKFFDSGARWIWSAPQSQIYTTLRKMQRDGLIEGSEQTRTTRMTSHVYSITDEGREELVNWVATPREQPPTRDAFLLQALYFDDISPEAADAVVREFVETNERLIEQWKTQRDLLLKKDTPLIRERLRQRPADQHERIVQLKAHIFQGQIDRALAAVQWAQQGLKLIHGDLVKY